MNDKWLLIFQAKEKDLKPDPAYIEADSGYTIEEEEEDKDSLATPQIVIDPPSTNVTEEQLSEKVAKLEVADKEEGL